MNTGLDYTLYVGFGSPPTDYELVIDTGSAYTWIGAAKPYVETKTSVRQEGQKFFIKYLHGSAAGVHYKDLVTLSPSLSIADMPFGVAAKTDATSIRIDGVLGLGPTVLGKNIVQPNNDELVPTFMDTLLAQGKIERNVFGLSFAPATSRAVVNGELTLGGANSQKYTGELNWVGITENEPLNKYWGFDQVIKYGDQILQPSSAGVLDSGATMIYITDKAFQKYSESIPGSKIDPSTELLEIPQESIDKMKSLFFYINGISYELTPSAQIWPREFNGLMGGRKENAYYSVVNSLGNNGGDNTFNFIMGYVFMQRFYTAYDASNSKIGFARATASGEPVGESTSAAASRSGETSVQK
ncbi:unnamed protein product [Rhizoctonia solani]|uniref:Peptidase A1 domain-containing protein n=1 Tax=Rhizoctonia solani TaxID=456999 RepID=A0A8H3C164_9AGAM|nr:unnamed protein product [Rhizoctonia solani]